MHHADNAAEFAPVSRPATLPPGSEQITGWHALQGLPIGILRGLAPGTDLQVCVHDVFEETADLAVADRVAWVLAARCGLHHVVLTGVTGYFVGMLDVELDWAAAMRLEPIHSDLRIVSVANAEGVLPILVRLAG